MVSATASGGAPLLPARLPHLSTRTLRQASYPPWESWKCRDSSMARGSVHACAPNALLLLLLLLLLGRGESASACTRAQGEDAGKVWGEPLAPAASAKGARWGMAGDRVKNALGAGQ